MDHCKEVFLNMRKLEHIRTALMLGLLATGLLSAIPLMTRPSVRAAETAPQSTTAQARTAFFFQDPQVINTTEHKTLRIALPRTTAFAANTQAVPVVAAEFSDVVLEYPIVFVKSPDGTWMALALTALQTGENLFVNADGEWQANYIPASVRRYPFVLAGPQANAVTVAVDMALATTDETGTALFDDTGAPAPILQNAIGFLQSFQGQVAATDALIGSLDALGLLTDAQFQIRDAQGELRTLDGFSIVAENRLNALRDDQILGLFRQGNLAAVQLHLLSLKNIASLQRKDAAVR